MLLGTRFVNAEQWRKTGSHDYLRRKILDNIGKRTSSKDVRLFPPAQAVGGRSVKNWGKFFGGIEQHDVGRSISRVSLFLERGDPWAKHVLFDLTFFESKRSLSRNVSALLSIAKIPSAWEGFPIPWQKFPPLSNSSFDLSYGYVKLLGPIMRGYTHRMMDIQQNLRPFLLAGKALAVRPQLSRGCPRLPIHFIGIFRYPIPCCIGTRSVAPASTFFLYPPPPHLTPKKRKPSFIYTTVRPPLT